MTAPKPKSRRRRFSDEFKRQAVDLYHGSSLSVAEVSVELGISESVLYRWVKEQTQVDTRRQHGSYAELEAENRRLRRENDFLKKASRYFASQRSYVFK